MRLVLTHAQLKQKGWTSFFFTKKYNITLNEASVSLKCRTSYIGFSVPIIGNRIDIVIQGQKYTLKLANMLSLSVDLPDFCGTFYFSLVSNGLLNLENQRRSSSLSYLSKSATKTVDQFVSRIDYNQRLYYIGPNYNTIEKICNATNLLPFGWERKVFNNTCLFVNHQLQVVSLENPTTRAHKIKEKLDDLENLLIAPIYLSLTHFISLKMVAKRNFLMQSTAVFLIRNADKLRDKRLSVTFEGEMGQDYGAIRREYMYEVAKEIFNDQRMKGTDWFVDVRMNGNTTFDSKENSTIDDGCLNEDVKGSVAKNTRDATVNSPIEKNNTNDKHAKNDQASGKDTSSVHTITSSRNKNSFVDVEVQKPSIVARKRNRLEQGSKLDDGTSIVTRNMLGNNRQNFVSFCATASTRERNSINNNEVIDSYREEEVGNTTNNRATQSTTSNSITPNQLILNNFSLERLLQISSSSSPSYLNNNFGPNVSRLSDPALEELMLDVLKHNDGNNAWFNVNNHGKNNLPDEIFYTFVGVFVALSIILSETFTMNFSLSFYENLLERRFSLKHVQDVEYQRSMLWILNNTVSENIIPGITDENKDEKVKTIITNREFWSKQPAYDYIQKGFYLVMPEAFKNLFSTLEMAELLTCEEMLSVEALKANFIYQGCTLDTKEIIWFWETLKNKDLNFLRKLLQFITGSGTMPKIIKGCFRIIIEKCNDKGMLFRASACLNKLYIGYYDNKEDMERIMEFSIYNTEGFHKV